MYHHLNKKWDRKSEKALFPWQVRADKNKHLLYKLGIQMHVKKEQTLSEKDLKKLLTFESWWKELPCLTSSTYGNENAVSKH